MHIYVSLFYPQVIMSCSNSFKPSKFTIKSLLYLLTKISEDYFFSHLIQMIVHDNNHKEIYNSLINFCNTYNKHFNVVYNNQATLVLSNLVANNWNKETNKNILIFCDSFQTFYNKLPTDIKYLFQIFEEHIQKLFMLRNLIELRKSNCSQDNIIVNLCLDILNCQNGESRLGSRVMSNLISISFILFISYEQLKMSCLYSVINYYASNYFIMIEKLEHTDVILSQITHIKTYDQFIEFAYKFIPLQDKELKELSIILDEMIQICSNTTDIKSLIDFIIYYLNNIVLSEYSSLHSTRTFILKIINTLYDFNPSICLIIYKSMLERIEKQLCPMINDSLACQKFNITIQLTQIPKFLNNQPINSIMRLYDFITQILFISKPILITERILKRFNQNDFSLDSIISSNSQSISQYVPATKEDKKQIKAKIENNKSNYKSNNKKDLIIEKSKDTILNVPINNDKSNLDKDILDDDRIPKQNDKNLPIQFESDNVEHLDTTAPESVKKSIDSSTPSSNIQPIQAQEPVYDDVN